MPDSTPLQSPSPAVSSLARLPRNARKRTFNLSLSLSPLQSHGSYACDFQDANLLQLDDVSNSDKCGESELMPVFEDWDDSFDLVAMEEDEIRNILFSPTSLTDTIFSTSSDSGGDDDSLSLGSDSNVNETSLTTSPITPSSISEEAAFTERSPKSTIQLSIDTMSTSFRVEDTFMLPSSILISDSPCWSPLICDCEPDVPSDCNHLPSPLDNCISKII